MMKMKKMSCMNDTVLQAIKKNEKKLTSCTSFLQIQVSLCLEFFVSHSIFTFPDEYLVQGMCIHFKFVFPVPAS